MRRLQSIGITDFVSVACDSKIIFRLAFRVGGHCKQPTSQVSFERPWEIEMTLLRSSQKVSAGRFIVHHEQNRIIMPIEYTNIVHATSILRVYIYLCTHLGKRV